MIRLGNCDASAMAFATTRNLSRMRTPTFDRFDSPRALDARVTRAPTLRSRRRAKADESRSSVDAARDAPGRSSFATKTPRRGTL